MITLTENNTQSLKNPMMYFIGFAREFIQDFRDGLFVCGDPAGLNDSRLRGGHTFVAVCTYGLFARFGDSCIWIHPKIFGDSHVWDGSARSWRRGTRMI